MISVVIIGRNEGLSVDPMIISLPEDWKIYYVADRCTDNTLKLLSKYSNVFPIDTTNHNFEGRKTSTCRNLGLLSCPEEDDILFLDGDRYVISGNIKKVIENFKSDILLFRLEEDSRGEEFERRYKNADLINGFFSCGVFFKREAINKILECPYNFGELFPEFLQDVWGIEDTSLGDLCSYLGLNAELCNDVKLSGKFERSTIDSIKDVARRLHYRDQFLKDVKFMS
jgi:hypothetical protein